MAVLGVFWQFLACSILAVFSRACYLLAIFQQNFETQVLDHFLVDHSSSLEESCSLATNYVLNVTGITDIMDETMMGKMRMESVFSLAQGADE